VDALVAVVKIILDIKLNIPYIQNMWTPIEIFLLTFLLNHSPIKSERLSVKEVIQNREAQLLVESVGLRNDF
jgi:hypothetical protein